MGRPDIWTPSVTPRPLLKPPHQSVNQHHPGLMVGLIPSWKFWYFHSPALSLYLAPSFSASLCLFLFPSISFPPYLSSCLPFSAYFYCLSLSLLLLFSLPPLPYSLFPPLEEIPPSLRSMVGPHLPGDLLLSARRQASWCGG